MVLGSKSKVVKQAVGQIPGLPPCQFQWADPVSRWCLPQQPCSWSSRSVVFSFASGNPLPVGQIRSTTGAWPCTFRCRWPQGQQTSQAELPEGSRLAVLVRPRQGFRSRALRGAAGEEDTAAASGVEAKHGRRAVVCLQWET